MAVEVSNGFKNMCKSNTPSGAIGRIKIIEDDITISERTDIQDIEIEDNCYVNDKFIGTTVAKKVKVNLFNDNNIYDLENKEIEAKLGFELNGSEELISYGNFIIEKPDTEEVQAKTNFVGYDYMIKFNKDFVDNNTYPIALGTYFSNLCTQVGVIAGNTTFINSNYMVQGNPFTNGEKCKEVLSAIAQIAGGIAKIGRDNKVYIISLSKGQAVESIDGNNYDTFEPNKVFGPINKLIIKMNDGVDGEESVRSDSQSITQNGECAITISNNPILNSAEQRELVIDNIFNSIKGITYLPFKTSYYGFPYADSTDKINVLNVNDETKGSYIFNHTIKYDGAFSGNIETPALTKTQSMYKSTRDFRDWKRNTELKVDKINGEITAVVATTEQIEREFETLQDIDGFAEGKYIYLDDASDELITSAKFNGETSQATRSGINRVNVTATTTTTNGVTCTVNKDKSVTLNGTNNGTTSWFKLCDAFTLPAGTYTLSNGNPEAVYSKAIFYDDNHNFTTANITTATFQNPQVIKPYIRINAGASFSNLTIYPMIVEGTYTAETMPNYEQYGVMPSPDYPSEIENIEGRNIFDEVLENGGFDTNGINGENVARIRSKNYISIKENTFYTISVGENNTGKTLQVSMSFYDTNDYVTSRISYISWTTLNKSVTFTTPANCKYMRFLISYTDSSAITINDNFNKFMIKKGTDIIPYAPYNSLEVKVVNKNIFDLKTFLTDRGVTYIENNDGSLTFTIISSLYTNPLQFSQEDTTVSLSGIVTNGTSNNARIHLLNSSNQNMGNISEGSTTLENVSACKLRFDYNSGGSGTVTMKNIQLEKGEPTEYEEHKEQIVYFPLEEGQKLYQGSYLADDGIHNLRGQVVFDGSNDEAWSYSNGGVTSPTNKYFTNTSPTTNIAKDNTLIICNRFKKANIWANDVIGIAYEGTATNKSFRIRASQTSLEDWRTWLSNNPVVTEYELNQEEVIPYNTEQQAAWNNIKSLHTYKTVTHIYSDAYAEIGYIKDNMLSAFETKASARLTQQDVQQLKIENGRISSEVSSTQSSLNNYYTKNEADNNTNSTKAELENIIQQNKTQIEQTTQEIALRVNSIETNGVDKIETSMGYTFDNNGLNIDKEGAATASTIDNEAFKVKNKSANENVFFAGYVSDQDSAYRGQTIVESTNLVVKNYLNIEGASRFQPYVNQTLGGHGTGAFDIG